MLAAARGQVKSLRWRLTVGAIFATGAALVLESAAAGFGWYLVLALSMCFDYMLGNSYLEQRGQADRKTAGVLFVWGSLFSIAIYAAMPVALPWNTKAAPSSSAVRRPRATLRRAMTTK